MKHFFIFSAAIGMMATSCSNETVTPVDQAVDGIHLTGMFDEVEESYKNGVGGWSIVTSWELVEAGAPNEVFQYAMFINEDGGGRIFYVGLLDTFYTMPTVAQLAARWHEGTYAFGKRNDNNGGVTKPGALIEMWNPDDSLNWATDLGWKLQEGGLHVSALDDINHVEAFYMASMASSFVLSRAVDSSFISVTEAVIHARVAPTE